MQPRRPLLALSSLAGLALLHGCANYATFQEADTLPQGAHKLGLGATFTQYQVKSGDTTDKIDVPAINAWYRYGVTDQLEAHAGAWLPLGASAGVKYQLLGNRTQSGLALSLGLDLGTLQITSKDADDHEHTATIVDTYVPVYLGYRVGPSFAAYLSPKYILRTGVGEGSTTFSHLTGGTVGLVLGDHTSLLLEGTVMYDFDVRAPAFQGGVGVAF